MPASHTESGTQSVLSARNLTVGYGSFVLMHDVSFDVRPGDIFFIMGGSGCGKSTLLRVLMGLKEPAKGSVSFLNRPFWPGSLEDRYAARRRSGVLFQQGVAALTAKRVVLRKDGTLDGAYKGSWKMYGTHYISVEMQGDTFLGIVLPAWIDHQNAAGLTVTAMGRRSGMALIMNSTNQI